MANSNVAFGLKPIGIQGQAPNSTGTTEYRIASGNTNAIYQGSPVIPLSTGFIDIVGAAAGGTVGLLGVFAGCEYVSSTTGETVFSNYWRVRVQTQTIRSKHLFMTTRRNCSWLLRMLL